MTFSSTDRGGHETRIRVYPEKEEQRGEWIVTAPVADVVDSAREEEGGGVAHAGRAAPSAAAGWFEGRGSRHEARGRGKTGRLEGHASQPAVVAAIEDVVAPGGRPQMRGSHDAVTTTRCCWWWCAAAWRIVTRARALRPSAHTCAGATRAPAAACALGSLDGGGALVQAAAGVPEQTSLRPRQLASGGKVRCRRSLATDYPHCVAPGAAEVGCQLCGDAMHQLRRRIPWLCGVDGRARGQGGT
eukprot:CAMPEP_0174831318 /NCGR_PEP_ID=MMETSP1114-20130205/3024_1 /TAXON_ID=312471 /ORGANISM="Neobodo designis, Strain CCAP 1951/1" /LENGTH=243 /DNA_ID=CAMNT_0016065139 /DNA_START=313 /DNA_END=1041 /DNA_ORIENTATION=+